MVYEARIIKQTTPKTTPQIKIMVVMSLQTFTGASMTMTLFGNLYVHNGSET